MTLRRQLSASQTFALSTGVKQWSSQKSGTRYTRNMVPEHHIGTLDISSNPLSSPRIHLDLSLLPFEKYLSHLFRLREPLIGFRVSHERLWRPQNSKTALRCLARAEKKRSWGWDAYCGQCQTPNEGNVNFYQQFAWFLRIRRWCTFSVALFSWHSCFQKFLYGTIVTSFKMQLKSTISIALFATLVYSQAKDLNPGGVGCVDPSGYTSCYATSASKFTGCGEACMN